MKEKPESAVIILIGFLAAVTATVFAAALHHKAEQLDICVQLLEAAQ